MLRQVLDQVRRARETPGGRSARVLPAHLESNFINPAYRGAQPAHCLRQPPTAWRAPNQTAPDRAWDNAPAAQPSDFTASDILREIDDAAADVAIVTLAPELDGGLDLIAWLTARGHRASLGHSARPSSRHSRRCRRRASRDASVQSHAAVRDTALPAWSVPSCRPTTSRPS
jgi:N-acetylglucosamine-6-phosphate deacetylase